MSTDSVERDILIAAPITTVWDVVTRPEHIRHWFFENIALDAVPGGELEFRTGPDSEREITLRGVVEEVDPPHRFTLSWTGHPGEPAGDHPPTRVEFRLSSEDGATRLHVLESGFDHVGLSGTAAEEYRQGHIGGWAQILPRISEYAPQLVTRTT